jgi:tetratricopeptide (TPR) repeat protein
MRWIILFPIIGSAFVAAQSITLPGAVVVQNSAYETGTRQYISDAGVRAPMSKPVTTDRSGKFVLKFSGVASGTPVRLTVSKPGYEVVNAREVQSVILGRIPVVEIQMADAQKLAEAQLKYYQIATDGIAASYHRKVAALRQENIALADRLAAFSAEREQEVGTLLDAIEVLTVEQEKAMENAQELAERFATTDLDNSSDLFRRAFELFQRGQMDSVLVLLSKERLDSEYVAARAAKEQANDHIRKVYNSLGLKADVLEATMARAGALTVFDGMAAMLKADPDAFTADAEYELAFRRGEILMSMARYANAAAEFGQGCELVRDLLGSDHIEQVRFLERWALALVASDSVGHAMDLLEQGFALMQGHEETEPLRVASLEEVMGHAFMQKTDPVAAMPHIMKGLALRRAHLPPHHLNVINSLYDVGTCHFMQGEYKEGLAIYEEADELERSTGEHYVGEGSRMAIRGQVYMKTGDLEKGESTLRSAIPLLIEELGPGHPRVFNTFYQLSSCLTYVGRYKEALSALDSALALNEGTIPEEHWMMVYLYHQRGRIMAESWELEAAVTAYERALAINTKLHSEANQNTAAIRTDLAIAKERSGDLEGAMKEQGTAFEIDEQIFGPDNPKVWDSGCRMACRLVQVKRDTAALNLFRKYLPRLKERVGYKSPSMNVVYYEVELGRALYRQGELDSARVVLEATIRVKPRQDAEWCMYRIAKDEGRDTEALDHVVNSARLFTLRTKDDHRKEVLDALLDLATSLGRQDVLDEFKE